MTVFPAAGGAPTNIKVLTVGDALFDCIANDEARGLSVEEFTAKNAWTAYAGGAPINCATALCKLGTPSAFCGCLGADPDGDELVELLQEIGVDTSLVQRTNDHPTRRVMVTRSLEGDREFGGFYQERAADSFADAYLDASKIVDQTSVTSLIKEVGWIVLSTLSLAYKQSAEAVQAIVQLALDRGANLYVDINWRPVFFQPEERGNAKERILQFARKATIVKMTDEEAEWLLDMSAVDALEHPERVHESFPHAKAVLVTAGEKGSAYSVEAGKHIGIIAPFSVNVVETTGAGDAFTAGILHGLVSNKYNLQEATDVRKLVQFASAVGALTCTREGGIAAQPRLEDVHALLSKGLE